ncbi:MAG: HlyD family efflux transporter periplasmic adaptor subunit [Bacteroidetes bacterium]|nr:HlyD family efflux transporter periplasmic adaptor subunit [Bacteroidota bacterium]
MKYNYLILILALLVFGCVPTEEKSDAFGNFESETLIVSSESAGKILQLNIEKGQKIEANFISAIIDTTQIKLKLLQADAQKAAVRSRKQSIQTQIEVFEEQKKNIEVNKSRILKMMKDSAATQKQLDDINGHIRVIDKQVLNIKTQFIAIAKEQEVIDAQKELLVDQLNRCSIKSPIAGLILETYVEQGELTTPGKPLFKIADLNELELKVYVSGAQLPSVKLGQTVDVLIDKTESENQTLSGTVTWISSEAEFTPKIIQTKEERVKLVYAVKVTVKNDGTLKIGMPGEVNFN